jgi:hypothetical protein
MPIAVDMQSVCSKPSQGLDETSLLLVLYSVVLAEACDGLAPVRGVLITSKSWPSYAARLSVQITYNERLKRLDYTKF